MRSSTLPRALRTSTGVAMPRAPQLLDDGQAVEVRQHPVGDDQIELPLGGAEQPSRPSAA